MICLQLETCLSQEFFLGRLILELAPGPSSVALALHVAGRSTPLGVTIDNSKGSHGGARLRMADSTQHCVLVMALLQSGASVLMLTIRAEVAIALSVMLGGGALFAS